MTDEYTCDNCGRTFEKTWSDDDALAEATELFGEIPPEERAIVCDDCWREIMAWSA